ncbi:hypothetical protein LTR37_008013 [Vermiconidia calcicola]|uniref:Uncharacterized protein n=1 Tax=Vermiconidia calcicola TaxID=1690605 RepID=A0ACC3NC26_9PEZI|nr:hypothetical protein LTR37_008013 [Vermiconidia calcicola]
MSRGSFFTQSIPMFGPEGWYFYQTGWPTGSVDNGSGEDTALLRGQEVVEDAAVLQWQQDFETAQASAVEPVTDLTVYEPKVPAEEVEVEEDERKPKKRTIKRAFNRRSAGVAKNEKPQKKSSKSKKKEGDDDDDDDEDEVAPAPKKQKKGVFGLSGCLPSELMLFCSNKEAEEGECRRRRGRQRELYVIA